MAQQDGKADVIEELQRWAPERVQWTGSSADLVSDDAQRAHAVNPVEILVGMTKHGSFYMPKERTISISLNAEAVSVMRMHGYATDARSIAAMERMVGAGKVAQFWNEFSAASLRGTIAHELSHWMDDSLHGRHIARKSLRAMERGTPVDPRYAQMSQSPIELNAQVHAVRDMRDKLGDAFEDLTWRDLLVRKPSLAFNLVRVGSEAAYQDVMRRFVQRLHREGLLAAGLRRIPTWAQMQAYDQGATE
jgi:hypothetical protein